MDDDIMHIVLVVGPHNNRIRSRADESPAYPFPNDGHSSTNEAIGHHLFLRLFDDHLYRAPVDSPKNIVDLGTGIGLWASGMADRFEDAQVLGIDLSPQRKQFLQPNLSFEVDSVTKEWPPRAPFDFVHLRSLYGAVDDWPALYAESFKCVIELIPTRVTLTKLQKHDIRGLH